jgi:hypothetical protein
MILVRAVLLGMLMPVSSHMKKEHEVASIAGKPQTLLCHAGWCARLPAAVTLLGALCLLPMVGKSRERRGIALRVCGIACVLTADLIDEWRLSGFEERYLRDRTRLTADIRFASLTAGLRSLAVGCQVAEVREDPVPATCKHWHQAASWRPTCSLTHRTRLQAPRAISLLQRAMHVAGCRESNRSGHPALPVRQWALLLLDRCARCSPQSRCWCLRYCRW